MTGGYDLVTVGETMVQIYPAGGKSLDEATDALIGIGGAESNVASYLAALGHRVAWASAVGDDPFGRRVLRDLSAAGVDTSWVRVDDHAPTGVYFKEPNVASGTRVHYYRSGSAAAGISPSLLEDARLRDTRIVHLSGITAALSESCSALVHSVVERRIFGGSLVSFDVNYRPALWPVANAAAELRTLAAASDLVFVGLDEAETLWGTRSAAEVRALLPEPAHLVVKDGAIGATSFGPDAVTLFEPAPSVDVVEPVGAGDAFAAGYLHGLLSGHPEKERLRIAHRIAGATLRVTADVGPLPF